MSQKNNSKYNITYIYKAGLELDENKTIDFSLSEVVQKLQEENSGFIKDFNVKDFTVYCYIQSSDLSEGWHYDYNTESSYGKRFGYGSNHNDQPIKTNKLRFYIKHGKNNIDNDNFLKQSDEEQIDQLKRNGFVELETYSYSVINRHFNDCNNGEDFYEGCGRVLFDNSRPIEKKNVLAGAGVYSAIRDDTTGEYISIGNEIFWEKMRQQVDQKDKCITQNKENELDEPIESLIVDNETGEKLTPFLFWIKEHCAKWVFNLVRSIYEYFLNSQTDIDDSLRTEIKNSSTVNDISRNNNQEKSPKLDQGVQKEI